MRRGGLSGVWTLVVSRWSLVLVFLHQFGEEIYLVKHLLLTLLLVCMLPFQGPAIYRFMPLFFFIGFFFGTSLLCGIKVFIPALYFCMLSSPPKKATGLALLPFSFLSLLKNLLKFCEVHWHATLSFKPQTFLHRQSMHVLFCACCSEAKCSRDLYPFWCLLVVGSY